MSKIRIQGWRMGGETISAIRTLMGATMLGLAESKRSIEKVLEGGMVEADLCEGESSEELVQKLRDCGFDACVVEEYKFS